MTTTNTKAILNIADLELTIDEQVLFEILQDGIKYEPQQYEGIIMTVVETMQDLKKLQSYIIFQSLSIDSVNQKIKTLDYLTQQFANLHGQTLYIYV